MNIPQAYRPVAKAIFGIALLGGLFSSTAEGACTGTSPNIVCTSSNGINATANNGGNQNSTPGLASPYPSTNVVTVNGTVNSVAIRLNGVTHTIPDNMDMLLVAPGGQAFVFWADVGGFGGGSGAISNQTYTISDSAATDLPDSTAPAAGSYKPKNYFTFADIFPASGAFAGVTASSTNSSAPFGGATFDSVFRNVTANGTWQLYVAYDGPETGTITSWDLLLDVTASNASTTTALVSSNNPVVIPLSGNSQATITATVTSGGNPVTLGAVTFLAGSQTLAANVVLNGSGQASVTFNTTGSTNPVLGEGSYTITANYSGATGFSSSTGTIQQVVDRATQVTGNTFCNTGRLTMSTVPGGPAAVYPSKIFVTGLSGTTQSVVLDFKGFSHPFTDDANFLLVSPTGQKFVPFAYISNLQPTSNANITLSDLAVNTLPGTGGVLSGTYLPSHGLNGTVFNQATFVSPAPAQPYQNAAPGGSATFTSAFSGAGPNGTWSLYSVNWGGTAGAGLRELAGGWCLTIGSSSDPATNTTPSVAPTPSALNQSTTVSALVTRASNSAPVNAQGSVTFKEGNTTLAGGPLSIGSNGVASFVKSDFTEGAHFIDALYGGVPGAFGLSSGQVLHYVDAPTSNPSAGRFCNTSALSFPTVSNSSAVPYPTRLNVSGMAGTVSKVTLSLNGLSAAFPDDVDMMLTAPNGNSLIAFSDVGGNTSSVSNVNLVLDSTSASTLPDTAGLVSGTFRPADYTNVGADVFAAPAPTTNVFSAATTGFDTAFNNSNPNGIWSLWTSLDGPGGGSLSGGWCIDLTMNQPQLTISKTHTGNFTQGQTGAQYTITVGSSGPGSTVGTITMVDTLPTGLTLTGLSGNGWSCTVATATCTTTATLAANGSLPPITAIVNVANTATSPQVNAASVSGGGAQGATVNDSTVITQVADLTITKTSSSSFVQGGTAVYNTTVFNIGAGATSGNYTISDTMPTGLTLVLPVTTPNGWDCTASTTTFLNCVKSTVIAAASSATGPSFTVNIASNAPASITNTAVIAGGGEANTANNSGSATSTVTQLTPDLTISKIASGGPFQQGGSVTYAITVTNSGNGQTTSPITMTDVMPTGLTATSATGANWSCTLGATVTCTRTAALAAGATSVITLVADIAANAPLSITNSVTVATSGESNSGNNGSSSVITVTAVAPDLTIAKVAQGGPFQQGGSVTYAITVTNSGNGQTTSPITMTDVMPTGLTATSATGTNWSCTLGATVTCTSTAVIQPNGTSVITLTANIAANAPASITNTATVFVNGESNTGNNNGSSVISVGAATPDLTISQTTTATNIIQGSLVRFDVRVSNVGTHPTTAAIGVNAVMPTGLTIDSVGVVNCASGNSSQLVCSFPSLAPGADINFFYNARVALNAPASITNTATVSGGGDTTTGNNSSSVTISVGPRPLPDLTIAKLAIGSGPFAQGSTMNFGITVSNLSQTVATQTNTTVNDTMPTGLTVTNVSGSNWSCTINGGGASFSCTRSASIQPNTTTQVILVTTQIASNAPASITNTATVTGDDDTPGNNSSSATINIIQPPDLTISKVATGGPFLPGGTVSYALTVSNVGTGSTTSAITMNDIMPTGLTATSATGANWTCSLGATVTCSRTAALAPGANSVITLVADIAANAPASITNTATVSGGGETVTNNNSGSSVITVGSLTGVTINVPAGVSYSFNGNTATGSQTFNVAPGTYALATTTPQSLGAGVRAVFASWSNGQPISHNVTVGSTAVTITGNFTTQFQLTTAASPSNGGTVTPASGTFYDSGTVVNVTATANGGFNFANWTGPVANASSASTTVTMDAAKSVTANFTAQTGVTINVPAGVSYSFNGNTVTGSQTFNVAPGLYTLSTTTPQSLGVGIRAVFVSWSNGQPIAHSVTVGSTPLTITGNFTTQFQLTTAASPSNGGTVTPASGTFFDSGTVVNVTATANSGFNFANWSGPVANASSASTTVLMDAAKSVTANFTVSAAPVVTGQFTVAADAVSFNRGTGRFSQRITVVNNGGALAAAAYVFDSLASGYSVFGASGVTAVAIPAGSPYRELGPIGAGASVTFVVEFTRVGTAALTYTPRVLGAGQR